MSIPSFAKTAFSNFGASLRTAFFLPESKHHTFNSSLPQTLVALLISFGAALAYWAYWLWPANSFSFYGFAAYLAQSAWFYFGIAIVVALFGLPQRFSRLVITVCYLAPLGLLASSLVFSAASAGYIIPAFYMPLHFATTFVFIAIATFRICWNSVNVAKWKSVPVTAGVVAAGVLGNTYIETIPMVEQAYEQTAEVDQATSYEPVSAEQIYYAQPDLMQKEIDGLHVQTDGVTDVYAVFGAGYADQSVFLSEVTSVNALFADTFGAKTSTITLANSRPSPTQHPLMNAINLETAINSAANVMDRENDTMVVFLTSHGSPEQIASSFYELQPSSITPTALSRMLDQSGVQNMVVILSACYSGSFVDDISAPGRTVITASAADRSSFGCADGRDWTYFGRAYFDEAFRQTGDFVQSFDIAKELVHEWETEAGQKPSLPQMSIDGVRMEKTASY